MLIENVLGSKSKIKLLRVFYDSPDREFCLDDLIRIMGHSPGTIYPSLSDLVRLRIILSRKAGRSTLYRINRRNPIVKKIVEIFSAEEGALLDAAMDFAKNVDKTDIVSIILFGSVARGEATGRSDVDVLIIYDKNPGIVKKNVNKLIDGYLEQDINIVPVFYSKREVEKMKKECNSFILGVEDEGRVLFGKSLGDRAWLE
ncbi:MAG: nucleotidyltransferase domain-containing protein [Methanocellales archaeon]|nr:nucleotidyltransferase domain-containing protein [Methanocellales archaeon]